MPHQASGLALDILSTQFGIPRERVMCDVLETAVPITRQDVVLVFITASGRRGDQREQMSAVYRVTAQDVAGETWSAIQITTASGICATLDMLRDGTLPARGFVTQEAIPLSAFLANRFGRAYGQDSGALGAAPAGAQRAAA